MVDEIYKQKLGVTQDRRDVSRSAGTAREWWDSRRGIRSFTTSPYVFTTFKNAQNYTGSAERPDRLSSWCVRSGATDIDGAAEPAARAREGRGCV